MLKHQDADGNKYDHMEEEYESGGSSGCYIATATLQNNYRVQTLAPLKKWRYEVLEQMWLGNVVSNFYRKTAPSVAVRIETMPLFSRFLHKHFVQLALVLAKQPRSLFANIKLVFLFLVGMLVVSVGSRFSK